jgi:hypothetical protein
MGRGTERRSCDAVSGDRRRKVRSSRRRWLARLAFAAAATAVVVPLAVVGLRSVVMLLVGVVGGAGCLAGIWWILAHHGLLRWVGGVVAVAAPAAVVAVYAGAGLAWLGVGWLALWSVAVGAGRGALADSGETAGVRAYDVVPLRRPFLIMNSHSGGGKVARFGLVDKAHGVSSFPTAAGPTGWSGWWLGPRRAGGRAVRACRGA